MKKIVLAILLVFILCSTSFAAKADFTVIIPVKNSDIVKNSVFKVMSLYSEYRIINSDNYRLVFERDLGDNPASFLLMDLHTLRNPVSRAFFNITPSYGGEIQLQGYVLIVASPDSPREMSSPMTNKEGVRAFESIVNRIKQEATIENEKIEGNKEPKIDNSGFIGWKIDYDMLVTEITPEGIAGKAGVKNGDTILEINGLDSRTVGDVTNLIVVRYKGGQHNKLLCKTETGILKTINISQQIIEKAEDVDSKKVVTNATYLGMRLDQSHKVLSIEPNGIAEKTGLKEGMIILKVNGNDTRTIKDLDSLLTQRHFSGESTELVCFIDGSEQTIILKRK